MATEELDLVEEILGPLPYALPHKRPTRRRAATAARLVLAFALGAIAVLGLVGVVVLASLSTYSNRIVPGVHVGTVDVSGLNRDQAIAKLTSDFSYLAQGEVTITTPSGTATITYKEAGRNPDAEFMADAALRIGHTGNPVGDAVSMLRTAAGGRAVPIAVRFDPLAVATRLNQLAGTSQVPPKDAHASSHNGIFDFTPSTPGRSIDTAAISAVIVDNLAKADAPTRIQVGQSLVEFAPGISDKDAQDAIAAADRMAADFTISWGSPAQSSGGGQVKPGTYTVYAAAIRPWIHFGFRADGTYGPSVDQGEVLSYLSQLALPAANAPVEPTVVFNSSGVPSSVNGGRDGLKVDLPATAQAVATYLDSLDYGLAHGPSVALVMSPVAPKINLESLANMTVMGGGKGAWTTTFFPGISNGYGANIRTPAKILNGQIVAAGQRFSFLQYIGTVDPAHGFALGGVIKGGKSDHTGAMGGGICSASTTMFNAAARAGLKIDERHAHAYYIDRYPVGLDATVFSNGYTVLDLKWTNDTPNPIVIRAWATYGSRSKITIQLWSLPLERKVTFSPEFKANVVKASDHKVYVTSLKPGQQNRAEYPTAGFSTSRTRTVTDSTGKVIHLDTWYSHYVKVDGLLQIGKSVAPPPTPAPTAPVPAPSPAILPPSPSSVSGTRRTARQAE
jgi:vancomycin resistance protein YoaR